jgi:hypothetical protein
MPTSPANLGDLVPLGQALMNMTWWGYVTDIDTPTGVWATLEAVGDEAFVTMDVLQGPRGFPGVNAPLVDILWDAAVVAVEDLPDAVPANKNKGYWIGDLVYISDGAGQWIPKRPGPAGPRGATPHFTISTEPYSWVDQVANDGVVPDPDIGGTDEEPNIHFYVPQGEPGPAGPSGPIRTAEDYWEPEGGPADGNVITWNGDESRYEPRDPNLKTPRFFTVPEGAFTNFSGVAQRQQICAFALPQLPFDWVPHVTGHIRAVGIEVDADPLIIGAEVRIGDPTSGPLIARGFGNISTWTTFTPHFSTQSTTMDAVTPDGAVGRVPAYHSGTQGTVYVNLYNDGLFGIYNYNSAGSQLAVVAYAAD